VSIKLTKQLSAITSIISTLGFWYFQRYFEIRTKPMFVITNIFTVLIPLYGMIGLWTDKIGYHNLWYFTPLSFPPPPPLQNANDWSLKTGSFTFTTSFLDSFKHPTMHTPKRCYQNSFHAATKICSSGCSELQTAHRALSDPM
jgi:hypothetical protein